VNTRRTTEMFMGLATHAMWQVTMSLWRAGSLDGLSQMFILKIQTE
jgi:hypothetical protein